MSEGTPAGTVFCLPDEDGGGQPGPFIDVVKPALGLTTAFPATLQGSLENSFGYGVVATDVPEPF